MKGYDKLLTPTDFKKAPCLESGPISQAARSVVLEARSLGRGRLASILRTSSVQFLFDKSEMLFTSEEDPLIGINRILKNLANFFRSARVTGLVDVGLHLTDEFEAGDLPQVEQTTGIHYGQLFKAFSDISFWDEPVRLLRDRLERNDISIESLAGRSVLDAGCGGGRYTVAWKLLGAGHVTGLDISRIGIDDARKRVLQANIPDVEFQVGNILQIPFPDNSFDIVFSNGVLHHTVDWQSGIREIVRVLRPGGMVWLYLIENPGGLFWDLVETMRLVMENENKTLALHVMKMLGLPANRIFYMLDHVLVPINLRLTPSEIEDCLARAGTIHVKRLRRGADYDRIEQIFRNKPYADIKYGVGENRYVFSK